MKASELAGGMLLLLLHRGALCALGPASASPLMDGPHCLGGLAAGHSSDLPANVVLWCLFLGELVLRCPGLLGAPKGAVAAHDAAD